MQSQQPHSQVPDLSVILVNWNSQAYVRQCLGSIYAHCRDVPFEVIVVDGGSFDGCGLMLARDFPSVVFVQSEDNIGFAKANNLGVRHAKGRCLLFLNPDTQLLEDSFRILMGCLGSLPQAGAVGCKLLNPDGSFQISSVQVFPTVLNQVLDSEYLRRQFPNWSIWGKASLGDCSRPAVVEAISGACIMTRRDTFEAVGGFTEAYFMYGEDVDLCFKISRAGYRVYHVPETGIVHFGGGSSQHSVSNFSNVMMRESVCRYLRLNRGRSAAALFRLALSASSAIRLLLILLLLPFPKNQMVRHGIGSLQKWYSILRWGLGLESWTRTYPGDLIPSKDARDKQKMAEVAGTNMVSRQP